MSILTVSGLSKHYGSTFAVQELDLTVKPGSIYGLLGPNGSGKTTTLGMILGVIRPSSGQYQWFDGKISSALARRRIGSILEQPNFYPYLSGRQNLQVTCAIRGNGSGDNINTVLDRVGLGDAENQVFSTYSLGMQQRLAIAATLVGDTDVLVLDEPTNGVDASGIAEIRKTILDVAKQGKTILLASHILDEVQKICTHISILKAGRTLASGRIGDVLGSEDQVEIAGHDMVKMSLAINAMAEVLSTEMRDDYLIARLKANADIAGINAKLVQSGYSPYHFARVRRSLEAKFLQITGEE